MRYEEGYLILDEQEVAILSSVLRKDAESRHEAESFVSTLSEMKIKATRHMRLLAIVQPETVRDKLMEETLVEYLKAFDLLLSRSYASAEKAGASIRMH